MKTDGILFDVDDTLVDTKGAFARALEAVRAEHLPHVPAERDPEILSHWRTDPGGFYSRYTRGEMDHVTQRRHRAALLHETFGAAPVTEKSFEVWDALFWGTFERSWTAHDDARAAIDAVVAAGLSVGVVTNAATELQERKLKAAGLGDLPVLVGVDTLGFGKPDPRVFLEGARRLGTEPSRTAYVGDEPTVDALAAHQASLTGVWLDRAGHRRGPGYGAHAQNGAARPGAVGPGAVDSGAVAFDAVQPNAAQRAALVGDPQDPEALRAAGVVVIETLAQLPAVLGYGGGH
ncbi:HAD family hydrolase [Promicromonospora kroppenstedtii]|uniref:HAD family hydrolase n=1 Tax=Promicromonospora kroppenstedtii TaxID=440482 RepID=UPI0004AF7DC4|nr:HAD family hydrolase [Promicromonospora kroppenstedtii]